MMHTVPSNMMIDPILLVLGFSEELNSCILFFQVDLLLVVLIIENWLWLTKKNIPSIHKHVVPDKLRHDTS